ncbi:MAG: DNA-3-methyladenine glycosylase family protein [Alphaproteobacteria bacterium]
MTVQPLDQARLEAGLAALAERDAALRAALARLGPPAPRVRPPGFATLLRIVTAQQVSTHAAAAIWGRLEARLGEVTPQALLTVPAADLRAAGLSARKVAYATGLARAVADGTLDVDALAKADDEAVVQAITRLKGFGRWSAEIYLLFALGRADAFPGDDLALRLALGRLKGLKDRLATAQARALVAPWAPWRGCGAIFLWHYHGAATLDRT